MPIAQIAGVALTKATKKMRDKLKKKTTGKPKGTGSALGIVGSASKAGMQGKQGRGSSIKRKPFQKTPNVGIPGRPPRKPRPPKSVFFRSKPKKTGRPSKR